MSTPTLPPPTMMASPPAGIREVGLLRPFHWLAEGWRDLLANPLPSLLYGAVVAVLGWLMLSLADIWPQFIMTAVSGFFLLAPLIAAGVYELSRAREDGRRLGFSASLAGLRRNAGTIADFGVVLVLVTIAWERLAAILLALSYGGEMGNAREFVREVFFSGQYTTVLLVWGVAGFVIASLVFAITAVGMPFVIDRNADVVTAMGTSLRAVFRNLPAMMVWAALIVLLTAAGMATAMIGLVLVMPLLGHATWRAYKDIVE